MTEMLKAGEGSSKHEDMRNGHDQHKIYSYNTYHTYMQQCRYFTEYIKEVHPECTTLRAAEKYVPEFMDYRCSQTDTHGKPLSAWTLQTQSKALNKLYSIKPGDKYYYEPPVRHREDIIRSRLDTAQDKHFSKSNNDEFIKFCQGTGCRRNVIEKLHGEDMLTREQLDQKIADLANKEVLTIAQEKDLTALQDAVENFPDQSHFIHHMNDKGGRDRYAPIIGPAKEQIIERFQKTSAQEKVWQHVPKNADIHGYRGDYATAIYKLYARSIDQIPYDRINKGTHFRYQSDVYVCRKDENGRKLDRVAMIKGSKALGHNRDCIIATNYLRGL